MNHVRQFLRARAATLTAGTGAAVLVLGGVSLALAPSAMADGTVIQGNPTCSQLIPNSTQIKVEPVVSGTFTDGTLTVVLVVRTLAVDDPNHAGNQTGSKVIDFTATGRSVLGVVVKGGPAGNFYDYRPGGVSSGTGLHSPVNPNNLKFYGLSHVSFCYIKTPPTSPPTSPPTTPPTTPPTSPPTTPPTTPPTSPPPSTPSETPSATSSTTSPIGTPSETESSAASVPTEVPAGLGGPDATNTSSGHGALYVGGLTLLAAGLALIGVGTARMKRGKHMA